MRAVIAVCVVAFCIALAQAQHQQGMARHTALELHPGLGHYHHPITTQNPEAQTYFDQGLTLLYGFNHDEAARYFRRAAELDPQAAMPYWGLALVDRAELQRYCGGREPRASHLRRRPESRRARADRRVPASRTTSALWRSATRRRSAESDWKQFHLRLQRRHA